MARISLLCAFTALVLNSGLAVANVHDLPGHEWIKGGPSDSRSPCPGLNTLANHGFLPRSGRNITKAILKENIMRVYNLDDQLAELFASSGVAVFGDPAPQIQLSDLNTHDSIEHDASLTRDDARTGDNHSMQPRLLEALLADAEGPTLSAASLAKSRNRRSRESSEGGAPSLNLKMRTLAYGETALILQALGKLANATDGTLLPPKDAVRQWIGEERLPNNFVRPDPMTFASTTSLSGKVTLAANVQEPIGLLGTVLGGLVKFSLGSEKRGEQLLPAGEKGKRYYGHGIWA